MKKTVIGILAHVDSGKTTLSEALLYVSGTISSIGRVDHKNTFLDTNEIERDRGITIFSKQAELNLGETSVSLLDTPGHVDFSAEAERTLSVLDYAILVISGAEGVQSHTVTLWNMLSHYNVPTFIFVNKMDLTGADKENVLNSMCESFGEGCLDFSADFSENAALLSQEMMDEYLENGKIETGTLKTAIAARQVFPCFFGSALKNEGVKEFAEALDKYTVARKYSSSFGARVYKISEDEKGRRLTHLKITGGTLKPRTVIPFEGKSEKVDEIRIYSGQKYKAVQEAEAGGVYAVTGLSATYAGQGLGSEADAASLITEPVLSYTAILPDGVDIHTALAAFKKIEEEDPQMRVSVDDGMNEIGIQVMGEIQLEVLKRIVSERFNFDVSFGHGRIIYKETIENTVEGVGHFEPLRHYAEVHLLLEPAKRGSGLTFASNCSEDILSKNWQRLILTHLKEKTHKGVLTGSELTDVKITIVNGKAHVKHTDGGDFRQATYRAVRQGLMQADGILLEPWYSFTLEVPLTDTGKAMTDLEQIGAEFGPPESNGDISVIKGSAPVSAIRDYHKKVVVYTHGMGRLSCVFDGYAPCKNSYEVITDMAYNPEADTFNTPDSVFCAHGSGYIVKWDEVFDNMDLPLINTKKDEVISVQPAKRESKAASEEELLAIYERTYGKITRKQYSEPVKIKEFKPQKIKETPDIPLYLLIDGYNIIFAWDDLKKIAETSLEAARDTLINRVVNYQAFCKINVILVFDAYKVKGNHGEIERIHGINVVYTKEAETADAYIEKTSRELVKKYRVHVATSDNLEQVIIFGQGAVRISASEFLLDIKAADEKMREFISRYSEKNAGEQISDTIRLD
ncbi:MAG: TetM/TetW/TetO/TetS family tetracycline resistance ribosomal protection protein [Clostridia bacterium]|nr:TetM/TetW/TetO/TetS family tetracycline resistance ribosomal protection protein [Clostridia bacterium]